MKMLSRAVIVIALVSPAFAAADGEVLRRAARGGDLPTVRAELSKGTLVDAPGRHGRTALLDAAENGRLEVAAFLIEKGANVNARESFFHTSPLAAALGGGHSAIGRLLIAKGVTDVDDALGFAIDKGDADLLRDALSSGRVEPLQLAAARRFAERNASPAIRELLAAATVSKPARVPFQAATDRLAAYAGRYRGSSGLETTVEVKGDRLALQTGSEPELMVAAIAEDRFENASGDIEVGFFGRSTLVEGMTVNRSGEITSLGAVTSDPAPLKTVTETVTDDAAAARTPARPWASFRGASAAGNGDGQGAPLRWDVKSGQNIRFKTKVPGVSLSSPIVWGDHIFVTTSVSAKGDKTFRTGLYGDGTSVDDTSVHSYRIMALDRSNGAVRWDREVHKAAPPVKRHMKSSQANATPTTDGRRVIALFGMVGQLVAYDFDGKLLWRRDVGVIECSDPQSGTAQWGHASSPLIYEDLVIIQADQVKDSFLAAFRIDTGEPVWRVARDEPSTWASPNVLPSASGDEIITNGQKIRGYDPRSGRLLWTLGPNSEVLVGTPVVDGGLAFVTGGYPPVRPVYALRPGLRGDVTIKKGMPPVGSIAWSHSRGGTYIPTPIPYRGFLYTVNNNGIVTCYRIDSGEQVYQTRLPGSSFAASPVAADGRIYFASETGDVYVLKAGPEFELLATNVMDEIVMATPAISDGLMVVRTFEHVVGISRPQTPAAR